MADNRHRYNGKEYSKGSRLSDYGARYYSSDIGRWAQIDPLAEAMSSWSPYNYGFNAPVLFIDPTGMAPEDNNDPDPTNDRPFGEADYASMPQMVSEDVVVTAPRSEGKNNESKNSLQVGSKGGRAESLSIGFAFGGGYELEIGSVRDSKGNSSWYFSHGPVIGLSLNLSYNSKAIRPHQDQHFTIDMYSGHSSGYSLGVLAGGIEFSANRNNPKYQNSDWRIGGGQNYNQLGFNVATGLDFGLYWSRTNTKLLK